MKTKVFDCIEMKRRVALRLFDRLKGLSLEEELAYWKERNAAFRRESETLNQGMKDDRGQ